MSGKQRHEYELKFRVGGSWEAVSAARQKFQTAGFMPGFRCIETDYLPDTPEDACKNSKMLLRFRQVEGASIRCMLLTLKIKQADSGVLHFREYETDLNPPDLGIITIINDLLLAQTGFALDETVIRAKTLDQVKRAANVLGFTKHRMLLGKYRENFSFGGNNATIDYFPGSMGVYVEFESHSAAALYGCIERARFDISEGIDTDYGDLLKLHKSSLENQAQRTALFSKSELIVLRGMIGGSRG
jgi:hypothetical protein